MNPFYFNYSIFTALPKTKADRYGHYKIMKITEKDIIGINNERKTVVNIHTELSSGVKIRIPSRLYVREKVRQENLPQNEPGHRELTKEVPE